MECSSVAALARIVTFSSGPIDYKVSCPYNYKGLENSGLKAGCEVCPAVQCVAGLTPVECGGDITGVHRLLSVIHSEHSNLGLEEWSKA